jgi:hypothetical protein
MLIETESRLNYVHHSSDLSYKSDNLNYLVVYIIDVTFIFYAILFSLVVALPLPCRQA